jgi:glycosyltransferase involved in cell wall biosynthesis
MKILLPNKFFLISRISNNIGEYFKNYKSIQLSVVHFLYFKLFKYIDKVVCPSKGLVQELKKKTIKKYYNKIELINNPVDYKYIIRQSKLKFSNNYLKKRFILNIGRLVVNKDHYTLVKSFKYFLKINKKKLNYILIIIGNGPLYHKLLNFIKKEGLKHKIIILQKINNPYIFIRKAKLFVLSSIFEGNPNVLLEAQVLKKKIISTDCNYGPREILEDGKYGYLVEKGDYKNLGLKMIKALKNKNMSIKYKKLMKKNSLKLISMKYQNLFKSLNEQ